MALILIKKVFTLYNITPSHIDEKNNFCIKSNINDTDILKAGIVSQIYNFPEKKVSASYDSQLTENYLVFIDKITDVSIDQNSDEYKKYFNLSKIRITNELFNTYDNYIKEKYKIDINYKALKTIKDYFN